MAVKGLNSSSTLPPIHIDLRDHKDCKERGAQDGHLDFHTAPVCLVQVQCCFTSTETTRTIRDGESRTATWTFTQLLKSAKG